MIKVVLKRNELEEMTKW